MFRNTDRLTSGYYYFSAKGAPHYPGDHWLGSRNWTSDEAPVEPPLGEHRVGLQIYMKGSGPAPVLPEAKLLGTADCIANGDVYPPPTDRTLFNGVDVNCWKGVPAMTLTVQKQDLSLVIPGVTTIDLDTGSGLILSQLGAGEALISQSSLNPDCSHTQRGVVNLAAQWLGAGPKYVDGPLGIGTGSPLSNSALDVRGFTYAYFAGIISFGGGNFPSSESSGAILQYDGSVGAKTIYATIAAADYGLGMAGGIFLQGTNNRFAMRTKDSGHAKYSIYDDSTSMYHDGISITSNGITTLGGLVVSAQIVPAPTGGPTGQLPPHLRQTATPNGTTQASGTVINKDVAIFTGVTGSNNAAVLPVMGDNGQVTVIVPSGATPLALFPQPGGSIRAGAANIPLSVAGGSAVTLTCSDSALGNWW